MTIQNKTFKIFSSVIALILLLSFSFTKKAEADIIEFYGDSQDKEMSELISEAKADGKTAVIYFNATWCAACKEFDSNITKKQVVKSLDDFRLIQVDVDMDKNELALIDKYDIASIPTIIEIDEEGELVKTISGDMIGNPAHIVTIFTLYQYHK